MYCAEIMNVVDLNLRRLRVLLELSRLDSMREVADELGMTTSSVSQHVAALAGEVGSPLVEPDGRRVRLTPAGRRLAEHAVTILAAVEAARRDLDPDGEPEGVVRVAGFATGIRRSLMPAVVELARSTPGVAVRMSEYEPLEALDLLGRDDLDVALVYDYNLAPAGLRNDMTAHDLWSLEWGLGVASPARRQPFAAYADHDWIVNSRHTADEDVLRTLASMAGFTPRVVHRIDSLELVEDLIVAGHGIALLPRGRATRRGVRVLPLTDPTVTMRVYAVTRRGRDQWPPLRVLLEHLSPRHDGAS
jgi:DNA-binding transcriptional LysR family regulator